MFKAITLRGGKVSRSWTYLLVGYISLALGLTAFMVQHFLTLHFLPLIGSAIMTAGGVLFIIGIYHEYRIWKNTLSK
jgi:membrane protein YdbS with pleckstrin-like domain